MRFFQAAGWMFPPRRDVNTTTKEEYERAIPIETDDNAQDNNLDCLSASKDRIYGEISDDEHAAASFLLLQLIGVQLATGFLSSVSPPRLLRLHP